MSGACCSQSDGSINSSSISSGPFSVKEWTKGDHILLEKNPNYWDAGKPYLDEVEFRIVPDEIELWQGRLSRLHDRLRYRRVGGVWKLVRLAP